MKPNKLTGGLLLLLLVLVGYSVSFLSRGASKDASDSQEASDPASVGDQDRPAELSEAVTISRSPIQVPEDPTPQVDIRVEDHFDGSSPSISIPKLLTMVTTEALDLLCEDRYFNPDSKVLTESERVQLAQLFRELVQEVEQAEKERSRIRDGCVQEKLLALQENPDIPNDQPGDPNLLHASLHRTEKGPLWVTLVRGEYPEYEAAIDLTSQLRWRAQENLRDYFTKL